MNIFRNNKGELSVGAVLVLAIAVIAVIVILGAIVSSMATIDPGYVGVKFDKQSKTFDPIPLSPGWNFVAPFVTEVFPMETRILKEEVDASAASNDMQIANTKIAVNYFVAGSDASWVFQNIGMDYKNRVVDPAIQESVKASTAMFSAEELLTKRETVRSQIQTMLVEKLRPARISVETVSITNFAFSPDFQKAIEDKQTAAQRALQAENDLKRIEVEAKQRIAQAEGEARAIAIQVEAITKQGGQNYIELKRIEKWDGIYPQYYFGGAGTAGTLLNIPAPAAAAAAK